MINKKYCKGCYNEPYHYGLGGSKECWCYKDAALVWKRGVLVDQVLPWAQDPIQVPDCYQRPGYAYVSIEETPDETQSRKEQEIRECIHAKHTIRVANQKARCQTCGKTYDLSMVFDQYLLAFEIVIGKAIDEGLL